MAVLTGTTQTQADQDWMDAAGDIDQETVEQDAEQFPHIQWVNGKPAQKRGGGVQYTGGWFISAEQLGGREPAGWDKEELVHSNGSSTEGFARRDVTVAMLHMRHCWLAKRKGEPDQVYTWDRYNEAVEYGNVTGKSHVLVFVQGLEELGPLFLTMKGSTSRAFGGSRKAEGVMGAFKRLVINPANALNQKRGLKAKWPYRAFWLTVGPQRDAKGEPTFTTVGEGTEQTQITLPTALGLHEKMADTELRALFVGKALLDELTIQYIETQTWAHAWDEIAPDTQANGGKAEAPAEPEPAEAGAEAQPEKEGLPF